MKKLIGLSIALAPLSAFAQIRDINGVTSRFTSLGNTFVTILISLAVIWVIYNVVRYVIATNDPEARKAGGMNILWGVVGLFVILSIWGLVNILRNSFTTQNNAPSQGEINNVNLQQIPQVPR